jgi:hypothetical protein
MATIGGTVPMTMGAGVWASLSGTGFTWAINNLASGDAVNRCVNVSNSGGLDGQAMTLTVTGTAAPH